MPPVRFSVLPTYWLTVLAAYRWTGTAARKLASLPVSGLAPATGSRARQTGLARFSLPSAGPGDAARVQEDPKKGDG